MQSFANQSMQSIPTMDASSGPSAPSMTVADFAKVSAQEWTNSATNLVSGGKAFGRHKSLNIGSNTAITRNKTFFIPHAGLSQGSSKNRIISISINDKKAPNKNTQSTQRNTENVSLDEENVTGSSWRKIPENKTASVSTMLQQMATRRNRRQNL